MPLRISLFGVYDNNAGSSRRGDSRFKARIAREFQIHPHAPNSEKGPISRSDGMEPTCRGRQARLLFLRGNHDATLSYGETLIR